MRFSVEHRTETQTFSSLPADPGPPPDPAAPDLSYLRDAPAALQSFFATAERIVADNPVAAPRLLELAGKARAGQLSQNEAQELQQLKGQALRQGRAIGAVIAFFLKLKPYPMLEEIRTRGKIYQPLFGPVLVVDGDTVREVLERDQDFTVEPYGVEMTKVMTSSHNGGFSTFVLSTDDNAFGYFLAGLPRRGAGIDVQKGRIRRTNIEYLDLVIRHDDIVHNEIRNIELQFKLRNIYRAFIFSIFVPDLPDHVFAEQSGRLIKVLL